MLCWTVWWLADSTSSATTFRLLVTHFRRKHDLSRICFRDQVEAVNVLFFKKCVDHFGFNCCFSNSSYSSTVYLLRSPMSFFFSWLFSQGSELLVHLFWRVLHNAPRSTRNVPVPCFFSISYVVPNPACAFKVTDTWNIISQPDWTICIQPLMPSSGSYPHTYTLAGVSLQRAGDIKRTRLAVGLCRKLSCTCVLWSVMPCPTPISTLVSCTSHTSDTVRTRWHYSCQENLCRLGGFERLTINGTIPVCQEWTSVM
jgi:hypothetical protein